MAKVFKDAKQMGKLMREVRKERGWSQSKLGHAMGITYQQVQKYEKGTNVLSTKRIGDMMKCLNLDLADFLVNPQKHLAIK